MSGPERDQPPSSPWPQRPEGRGARGDAHGGALPPQRPTWLVMLASVMAMVAFQNFGEALDELAGRPRNGPVPTVAGEPDPASAQQALQQTLSRAYAQAVSEIPPSLPRMVSLLKMAYAAIMLLAVAGVATRDRRGRAAALASAWAGIAHHVAAAVVFLTLVRPALWRRSAEWSPAVQALAGPGSGVDAQAVPSWMPQAAVVGPALMTSLLGIGFCTVVMVFFGGRRGKSYYGLAPVRAADAARTGA